MVVYFNLCSITYCHVGVLSHVFAYAQKFFSGLVFRGYEAIIARHSTYCVVDACLHNWFKHAVNWNTLFYLEYPIYRSCKVLKFMLEKMKNMFLLLFVAHQGTPSKQLQG